MKKTDIKSIIYQKRTEPFGNVMGRCKTGEACMSSKDWYVQQETVLPGKESESL